jgi:2-oxoglutarate ferredoxin oxidoreductase subunit beta
MGCTGRISDYLKYRSFQVTDAHLINFAAGLKARHPASRVAVFINDADLIAADTGEFISACKKGVEILVIYVNNYIYRMLVEHRRNSRVTFMGRPVDESVESPFNMPHAAKTCGASYVARWTPLHSRRLEYSMTDALQKGGFSLIEVIIPCLMYHASNRRAREPLDRMQFFRANSEIRNNEPTQNLDLRSSNKIIVGTFVNT